MNFIGACVWRNGGPNEQSRAGGCGRTGRVRGQLGTDRPGGCRRTGLANCGRTERAGGPGGRGGRAHARTIVQNNSFIIPFISIHLLNNFLMFRSPAFSSQFSCKFLVNNSFSTTISSVDFICKSIPLTF